MISETLGLFELLRTLVQRKSELDKEYFENFVQPIWLTFDTVHDNYVNSFLKCKNYLEGDDPQIEKSYESLIKILENDSIIYSDSRQELEKMIKYLPSGVGKVKEQLLSEFIKAIYNYFADYGMKSLRDMMVLTLYRLNKSDIDPKRAEYVVSTMLEYIQPNYKEVADKYYRLKKGLLT